MNKIRDIRDKARITQAALRRKLGWLQSRLANYESGARTPSLNDAREIVYALNDLGATCCLEEVFPAEQQSANPQVA